MLIIYRYIFHISTYSYIFYQNETHWFLMSVNEGVQWENYVIDSSFLAGRMKQNKWETFTHRIDVWHVIKNGYKITVDCELLIYGIKYKKVE